MAVNNTELENNSQFLSLSTKPINGAWVKGSIVPPATETARCDALRRDMVSRLRLATHVTYAASIALVQQVGYSNWLPGRLVVLDRFVTYQPAAHCGY